MHARQAKKNKVVTFLFENPTNQTHPPKEKTIQRVYRRTLATFHGDEKCPHVFLSLGDGIIATGG